MNARVWKIAPLLFGSGFCALVYQMAWQRELRRLGESLSGKARGLLIRPPNLFLNPRFIRGSLRIDNALEL